MEKTLQTALVLSPPQDRRAAIQTVRAQHDRNFRRWMPHITLLYPFCSKVQFEGIADRLGEVSRTVAPFDVELATFRFFQHGPRSFTFWLAPEPAEAVIALQTALWQVAPDFDDVRRHATGFTPHLSMGQVRSQRDLEGALGDLQQRWTPVRFRAERVDLIWRNEPPDDVFHVGYSVALGTGEVQRVNM